MDDVLEVRLHRPTVADLILVDGGEQPFKRTLRPSGAYKIAIVAVELLSPLRNVCVASCDAEFVIGAFFAQTDKLDAGVGVEIDQIAVSRCPRNPAEYADTAIVAVRHSIDLLLKDSPRSNITRQLQRFAAAGRRRQRNAVRLHIFGPENLQSAASRQL